MDSKSLDTFGCEIRVSKFKSKIRKRLLLKKEFSATKLH